jgi:hypothetical protein
MNDFPIYLLGTDGSNIAYGQQNNIGGTLQSCFPTGEAPLNSLFSGGSSFTTAAGAADAVATSDWFYVFPPNAAGLFRVSMKMAFLSGSFTGTGATADATILSLGWGYKGNVVAVEDIYGGEGSKPNMQVVLTTPIHAIMEFHVKVTTATGGQNNLIVVNFARSTITACTPNSYSFEVMEVSQKSFQSNSNFVPQFLDNLGNVVEAI